MRIGLTGGIGAGKTTVARRLAELGAVIVDSDQLARAALDPGTAGLAAVRTEFGEAVLAADGSLDRAGLARVVFSDPDALARLNAVVHPIVRRLAAERDAAAGPDTVVVHDIPLLVETGRAGEYDRVVVVQAPAGLRIARLLAGRDVTAEQIRARMAAQATDEQRRAVADVVLVNDGSPQALIDQVDHLWRDLQAHG